MSNSKISALTSATTPLAGTETLPVVQSSTTKQVSVANLTAGRAVTMLSNTMASASAVNDVDKTGGASYGYRMKGNDQANVRFRFENTGGQIYELVGGNPGASNSGFAIYDATSGATRVYLSSAGDVTLNTGNLVIGTSGNGLTSTGTITVKSSSGGTNWQVFSSASATNPTHYVQGSGSVNGIATGANAAASAMYVNKDSGSTRSINAAGTINAAGLDYAEYMAKDSDFVIAKGEICGVKANGKLTNVFSDAISFVVKSTDPSYVGGDTWFNEQPPQPPIEPVEPTVLIESEDTTDEQRIQYQTALAKYQIDFEQYQSDLAIYNADLASWKQRLETARSPVDRIAFCGQVPVNVQGAVPGQFIIPVDDNGAIKGQAISNPTFEQYQNAIGKVIAIEADGRAKIIVKIS